MGAGELEALGLTMDRARTSADFFQAYGESAVGYLFSDGQDESRRFDVYEDRFAALVDQASAFRLGGQWAALFDTGRAQELFARSGAIFDSLGFGFGVFVLAAFGEAPPESLHQRVEMLVKEETGGRQQPASADYPPALRYPQQQAYLMLAAAAVADGIDLPRDRLLRMAHRSPHRRGVLPMGALSTPIRVYWDLAVAMLAETGDGVLLESAFRFLHQMSIAYESAMAGGMVNSRLWRNGAAPVDVVDVDVITVVMLLAQRLGPGAAGQIASEVASELTPLARVTLNVALEMLSEGTEGRDRGNRQRRR